jgi:O-antigen/teichoic acid export membrane protein
MRIIENLVITAIVNKRYPFLNGGETLPIDDDIKRDIVKKIKALLMHKIGGFTVFGSDNIVISIFLGIKTVGLYSNYYLVISAISNIISQAFTAITASIGNLLIANNHKKSFDIYDKVRFANFWLASVATIGLLVAMDSFVTIWLGNKYVLPIGVLLALGVNLYLQLMRSVTNSFKEAAGIFHEDRFIPLVESIVNIVFSIIFLQFFGLAGVFMGTICSNLVLHLFSYPKFVYTRLFKRSYREYYIEFVKYLVLALIAGTITFYVSRTITVNNMLIHFIINVVLSIIIPSTFFWLIYRKSDEFIYFKNLFKKIFSTMNNRVHRK